MTPLLLQRVLAAYFVTLPILWPLGSLGSKALVAADVVFPFVVLVVLLGAPSRDALRESLPMLLPLLAVLLSTARSGLWEPGFREMARVAYSGLAFYCCASAARRVPLLMAWKRVAGVWSLVSLSAWFMALLGFESLLAHRLDNPALGGLLRVHGPAQANSFALFLGLSLVTTATSPRWTGWDVPSALTLLLTMSRTITAAGVTTVLAVRDRIAGRGIRRLAVATACGLLAVTVLLTLFGALIPIQTGRPQAPPTLAANAYFITHTASMRAFLAHPWTGLGPVVPGSIEMTYATPEERRSATISLDGLDPHSMWLGTAARFGLAGVLAWSMVLAAVWRRDREGGPGRAVVLLVVLNAFVLDLEHLKFVWAYLGLLVGEASRERCVATVPSSMAG